MIATIDLDRRKGWHIYARLIGLLGPHWVAAAGAAICVLAATGLSLVVPALLEIVIDVGVKPGHGSQLVQAGLAVLVISALRGLFAYGQGYLSEATSQRVAYDLRRGLYDHLQTLSFSFHDQAETGQLMSRMTADIEAARNFMTLGLLRALVAVVTFGAIAVILVRLDWHLALITFVCVPIISLLAVQVASKLRPLWLSVQNETGALSTVMQESLAGQRVVKAFAREDHEIQKFGIKNKEVRDLSLYAARLSAFNQPLMVLALNVITALVVWFGGYAVVGGSLSVGTLFAATQYALLLGTPVRTFGFMVNWFTRAHGAGERIFGVLDTPPDIADAPGARPLEAVTGHVRFEEVAFGYDPAYPVVQHIEIDARPGQVIALLGATGSGKSTIIHLLPRFYDVTMGRILIDGTDIREVTLESLRRSIGVVLQDVFLFNATVADNIAYGVTAATDQQVVAAARAARIHDFIMSLPDGYETWVGERGVTLSGGQKQRVAIARTLLLNPRILVLDDATSSVDMETEYLIQQALAEVMRGRTTFVVASRLRTIKNADQILVLEGGRIVERGTHDALLAKKGSYARLYDLQLRDQEELEDQLAMLRRGAG
jgi:ATP-binding cassette subfamily B protein